MAKFKNIHSETGRFTYNGMRIAFNGEIETEDKGLINFLSSNSSFKLVEATEDTNLVDPTEIVESVELEDIELKAQDKKSLVTLAESLSIETKGLNKEQIIEQIEKNKLDL